MDGPDFHDGGDGGGEVAMLFLFVIMACLFSCAVKTQSLENQARDAEIKLAVERVAQ